MQIEITTTKKTLNKKTIKQMMFFFRKSFVNVECLGYIVNQHKWFGKLLLLHDTKSNDYFLLPFNLDFYNKERWKYIIGKWKYSYEIKFDNHELAIAEKWFEDYVEICKEANHIYI